jgi:uncharacterized protein HemX
MQSLSLFVLARSDAEELPGFICIGCFLALLLGLGIWAFIDSRRTKREKQAAERERQKPQNMRRELELQVVRMKQKLIHLEEKIGDLRTRENGDERSAPALH